MTQHKKNDNLTFPVHLYEPIRLSIAKGIMSRELKKILVSSSLEDINSDLSKSFPENDEPETIREFWNFFDALVMGKWQIYSLKALTSNRFTWKHYQNFPIDDLVFTHDVRGVRLKSKGVEELQTLLKVKTSLREIGIQSKKRFLDPIIVTQFKKRYHVIDGNNRLYDAIINGQDMISAFVGVVSTSEKHINDEWVATAHLFRLATYGSKSKLGEILTKFKSAKLEFQNYTPVDRKVKISILSNLFTLKLLNSMERLILKVLRI